MIGLCLWSLLVLQHGERDLVVILDTDHGPGWAFTMRFYPAGGEVRKGIPRGHVDGVLGPSRTCIRGVSVLSHFEPALTAQAFLMPLHFGRPA